MLSGGQNLFCAPLAARGFRRRAATWNLTVDGLVQVIHFPGGSTNVGRAPELGIFVPALDRLLWDRPPPTSVTTHRCHLRADSVFPLAMVARWRPGYPPPFGTADPPADRLPVSRIIDYEAMLTDLLAVGLPALERFSSLHDVRAVAAAPPGTQPWLVQPSAALIVPLLDRLLGDLC